MKPFVLPPPSLQTLLYRISLIGLMNILQTVGSHEIVKHNYLAITAN